MGPPEFWAIIRAFLGFVLVMSGAGKMADREGTAQASIAYGVPVRWSRAVATLLGPVELIVGIGLICQALPLVTASITWLIFCGSLVGVSRALAHHKEMHCHCFGQITEEKLGTSTLVRLLILLVISTLPVATDVTALRAHGLVLRYSSDVSVGSIVPIILVGSIASLALIVLSQIVATVRQVREF